MHNANVGYMAFEFVANQLPFVIWHIVFMLFYATAYVIFSWIWHHLRGIYYYYFLDYERPGAIFWYLGLLIGISILFLAGYFCSLMQYNYNHTIPNLVSILRIFQKLIKQTHLFIPILLGCYWIDYCIYEDH